MPKRIPLHDSIEVDGVDLSNFCRMVRRNSEHSREDVSGFSETGVNEYLAGPTEQSLVAEFYGSYGASEVHATLDPIHANRETVLVKWRPNQNAAVSATNPEARGMVQLFNYSPGGTRGDVDTFEVTFNAADEDGIAFFAAALP
jgi:hypothetical protein